MGGWSSFFGGFVLLSQCSLLGRDYDPLLARGTAADPLAACDGVVRLFDVLGHLASLDLDHVEGSRCDDVEVAIAVVVNFVARLLGALHGLLAAPAAAAAVPIHFEEEVVFELSVGQEDQVGVLGILWADGSARALDPGGGRFGGGGGIGGAGGG